MIKTLPPVDAASDRGLAQVSAKIEFLERLMEEKINARDRALTVAMATMDTRLDGMNEFRDTLRDQSAQFVTRDEYQTGHAAVVRNAEVMRIDDQAETQISRSEVTVLIASLQTDVRRLEIAGGEKAGRDDSVAAFDRIDLRLKVVEGKLATWDGRLWALGSIFLMINIFVSWWLSGIRLH